MLAEVVVELVEGLPAGAADGEAEVPLLAELGPPVLDVPFLPSLSVRTRSNRFTSSGCPRRIQRVPSSLPVSSPDVARKITDFLGFTPLWTRSRTARSCAMAMLFMSKVPRP
jgi:hypothetical protein